MEPSFAGDFAIVAEGRTDQIVIGAILRAFFEEIDHLVVNDVQPPYDVTGASVAPPPGGWSLVIDYFKRDKYLQALQTNRYLIVHIDTDRCDEYGVPRHAGGKALSHEEHVAAIRNLFLAMVGTKAPHDRFVFAIAVDSIECWLLPFVLDRSQKTAIAKTTGCLKVVNDRLRALKERPLSTADLKKMDVSAFTALVRKNPRRRAEVVEAAINPGFASFLSQIQALPPIVRAAT